MTTTRRILHVCQPTVDGAPNVLLSLVRDQVARGWRVDVAGPASSGYLLNRARELGATTHTWESKRSPGPSVGPEALRLGRILATVKPDVVHLHSSKAGMVGRLVVRGRIPTIFEPHAWSYEAVDGRMRTASLSWERLAVRWTSLTLCVSETERRTGEENGTLASRTVVIPNGVDTTAFHPTDRAEARSGLGLTADGPLVVCLGRLTRQKGQDVLLRAWPRVKTRVPDAHLAIVGDGPDVDQLRETAPEGVTFHPNQAPQPWFAAADVVAMPSRWEGMPLILLEAMASGRPVVATDVAGIADATGPGDHLVSRENVEQLADALVARLVDPELAQREGEALRERAVASFDVAVSAARCAEETERLVHSG